jgi:hypothetical protein
MPLTDADLIDLLKKTTAAIDEEAAWLVDVDMNDEGQQRHSIPAHDRRFFDALSEQAQSLRSLIELIQAR